MLEVTYAGNQVRSESRIGGTFEERMDFFFHIMITVWTHTMVDEMLFFPVGI